MSHELLAVTFNLIILSMRAFLGNEAVDVKFKVPVRTS